MLPSRISWSLTRLVTVLSLAALFRTTPLQAAPSTCVTCHAAETRTGVATSMAHALSPASAATLLITHPDLRFKTGDTEYLIHTEGDQVTYQIQRGTERLTLPIQWAFGVGNVGQTYVYLKGDALYEARVSFYRSRNGLDITTGHKDLPATTITEAAGRLLSEDEATRCFGCHTSSGGTDFQPGVQCTACHANADEHAASFASGNKLQPMASLHSLTSGELADFCGRCHRQYATVQEFGPKSVLNVRFQPYRLVGSRCFNPNDARISCVACHNPHQEVRREAAFYDAKCQACHVNAASAVHTVATHSPNQTAKKSNAVPACPVAKQNCTTCHMPKVELPEMHGTFTDHRVRIVHKGETYPN